MPETPAAVAPDLAADDAVLAVQLERRRRAAAEHWQLDAEVVLIRAGDKIPVPGRGDRTYPFRAHSEYLYLTDRERDRRAGASRTAFKPRPPPRTSARCLIASQPRSIASAA